MIDDRDKMIEALAGAITAAPADTQGYRVGYWFGASAARSIARDVLASLEKAGYAVVPVDPPPGLPTSSARRSDRSAIP